MSDDNPWREASQTLAADNARLCGRLLTAEAVVERLRAMLIVDTMTIFTHEHRETLSRLIAAHDAGKAN